MSTNPTAGRLRRLFQGRDASHYTLPHEFDDLLKAADHLRKLPLPADTVADERQKLHDGVRKAALTGGDLPSLKALAAAAATRPHLTELAGIRQSIAAQLDGELTTTVAKRVDEIIVEHLRPAQEETLAEAATALEKCGGRLDLAADLYAQQEARAAAAGIVGLADRYGAIRSARALLVGLQGGPQRDAENRYGELRNLKQMWPTVGTWQQGHAPWPDAPAGRLAWLVTSEADPWCPTRDEQDDWFAGQHPTEADKQQAFIAGRLVSTHE